MHARRNCRLCWAGARVCEGQDARTYSSHWVRATIAEDPVTREARTTCISGSLPGHDDALRACRGGGYSARYGWRRNVRLRRVSSPSLYSRMRRHYSRHRWHGPRTCKLSRRSPSNRRNWSRCRGAADVHAVALDLVALDARRIRRRSPIQEHRARSLRARGQRARRGGRCRVGWDGRGHADGGGRPGNISRTIERSHDIGISGSCGQVDVGVAGDPDGRDGCRAAVAEDAIAGKAGATSVR